jgi:aldehyde dehydrogenase (NAD+)
MYDLNRMRAYFAEGNTFPYEVRKRNLEKLFSLTETYEDRLAQALYQDLGKSKEESYMSEISVVRGEIKDCMKHLKGWMKPKKVSSPLTVFPAKSRTVTQPRGLCLIMSPWNYPLLLSLSPLTYALCAGNVAVLKPSRYSTNTSTILRQMLSENFSSDIVQVVEGGHEANQALLEEEWDLIFFTGSKTVGKLVMSKASEHLTPVVLELGGKSPAYIDASANLDIAAKRLAWGKFLNAGQTCVAPDYVLIQKQVFLPFLALLKKHIQEMYTPSPIYNKDYPKIINPKHFDRLVSLLRMGQLNLGGQYDPTTRKIAPTVLVNPELDSPLMQDEIFGPILPVLKVDDFAQAMAFIEKKPTPLAFYLFSKDNGQIKLMEQRLRFGGGCINDCILHLANQNIPFGGVGQSGMGNYHGQYGYLTFSHQKAILEKGYHIDIALRYPPYEGKMKQFKRLLP